MLAFNEKTGHIITSHTHKIYKVMLMTMSGICIGYFKTTEDAKLHIDNKQWNTQHINKTNRGHSPINTDQTDETISLCKITEIRTKTLLQRNY